MVGELPQVYSSHSLMGVGRELYSDERYGECWQYW